MIDAILAEAAERHGIRHLDGVQVVGAAALARRAFDPSWPLLLLPDPEGASGTSGEPAGPSATMPGRSPHLRTEPPPTSRRSSPRPCPGEPGMAPRRSTC